MNKNRFVQAMLVVIAVLLGLNLIKPEHNPFSFATNANAQLTIPWGDGSRTVDCRPVRGYTVSQLGQVVTLGDGKTFIVSNPNGFMVYQVDIVAAQ